MRLKIEISIQNYARMLDRCDMSWGEYDILVKGKPIRRSSRINFARAVEIICSTHDVTKLLALADRICPEAAQEIEHTVDFCNEK